GPVSFRGTGQYVALPPPHWLPFPPRRYFGVGGFFLFGGFPRSLFAVPRSGTAYGAGVVPVPAYPFGAAPFYPSHDSPLVCRCCPPSLHRCWWWRVAPRFRSLVSAPHTTCGFRLSTLPVTGLQQRLVLFGVVLCCGLV